MSKFTMGRTRKKSKTEEIGSLYIPRARTKAADAVFVFGAAAVCVMLVLPMLPEEHTSPRAEAAVMVMSGAVREVGTEDTAEREELVTPSNTEFDEEWNFYDYIGELFAGLLSGQG
ncbi:MAG: hypothetical protein IJB20_02510 [Clostridia bacterium]|nr:hypothetical protein [Clostridia bacterium]